MYKDINIYIYIYIYIPCGAKLVKQVSSASFISNSGLRELLYTPTHSHTLLPTRGHGPRTLSEKAKKNADRFAMAVFPKCIFCPYAPLPRARSCIGQPLFFNMPIPK